MYCFLNFIVFFFFFRFSEVKSKFVEIVANKKTDDASVIEILTQLDKVTPVPDDICTLMPMLCNTCVFCDKKKVREAALPVFRKLQVCLSENIHLKQKPWWRDFKLFIEKW